MKILAVFLLCAASLSCPAKKSTPAPTASATQEQDIVKCEKDSDCIIVPYRHCCGSTKKAINRNFLNLYNKTPEWQKFDNQSSCAVMGVCMSDTKVKDTKCEAGQCQLRFPTN